MKVKSHFQRELDLHTRIIGDSYFDKGGSASGSRCPRKGYMWLKDKKRNTHVVETACRSWGCLGCRDKVLNRVKSVLKTGLLTSEDSWLITNTLRMDQRGAMGVDGVRKVWVSFMQMLRRCPDLQGIEWFKVTELTKKGQVHLHWTSLGPKMHGQCSPRMGSPRNGRACLVSPECLEHRLRRFWLAATGDSYIVDVRRVFSVKGACTYLAKYFFKTAGQREELEKLGFKRRYDTSRGWPREKKLRLRGTVEGWEDTGWYRNPNVGAVAFASQSQGARELELVGPERALKRVKLAKSKRLVNLGKVLQNESVR